MKKIYVGNLNFATTEEKLSSLFSQYGEVASVTIIKDKFTEQSKGFGFVEMSDDSSASSAISALDGKEVDGRRVRVNEAVDKPRRPRFNNGDSGYGRRGFDHGSDRGNYGRQQNQGRDFDDNRY